jgi:metallo-beta-lactamase family protein
MKIRFEGAAQTVTGSQTLIEHHSYMALVDCGLYQGAKANRLLNWEKPEHLNQVQAILITHAHIDHSGLVPRWARWGWKGKIFCTKPTADLLKIMLLDSARLQVEDAKFANLTKHSHYDPALPLYEEKDALAAIELLHTISYEEWHHLSPTLSFRFMRAGHILGSAILQISAQEPQSSKSIIFSGDLGGGNSDTLKDPVGGFEADALVLESTYGDRNVNADGRETRLAEVINKVIGRGGTLVIPAFALGRTQDLLLSIYELNQQKRIPNVPVFLDSPMANAVTAVYLKNLEELRLHSENRNIEACLSPSYFHTVESPDDSMLLCMSDDPKIVISASGMLQGGRVLHHLKHKLPNEKNGVLFVGYQGKETKGRLLVEGAPNIRIHHQELRVEAEIFTLEGYSAHGDSDDLLRWLGSFRKIPQQIFLNHGEIESQIVFQKKIEAKFKSKVEIPSLHQEFIL